MARKVFFSFKYDNVARAVVVRNSDTIRRADESGFVDKADFEQVERQGATAIAIANWIDRQFTDTTFTVLSAGAPEHHSRWVRYEIAKSIKQGNGLLGIDTRKIDILGRRITFCGSDLPAGYPCPRWNRDNGYANMGGWFEKAAWLAGK
ncbi:TIR domain-containing protein [Dyella sp. 333MFSha]|uniref:TIR domain-containing protein n=1 Tax=Dyella sp. 333MFSha TaxID=1798240 RepID=UPI00088E5E8C|nr:TIR domain-containing protein [Dyella sp. 333MFSha]SDF39636.1 MTH538 TIR-like domain [Dyella sp. 333MFSha]